MIPNRASDAGPDFRCTPTSEPTHCESCNKICQPEEMRRAVWDETLLVGECCAVEEIEVLCEPICPVAYGIMSRARTVGEMCDLLAKHHTADCVFCSKPKKEPVSVMLVPERKVA